jgi:cellobiose dehydrogenase (acceptor)
VFYDFYEAYDDPIPADEKKYLGQCALILCNSAFKTNSELDERSGILAQAAPNIGPIIFDEISGADGRVRSIQWTARVEPSLGEISNSKCHLTDSQCNILDQA